MTARTIIIRQVASKHSNFVVTEYISCRRPSLMFSTMFWMRKMLMSANLEWRVVREGSSHKQWVGLGVCLHFCVKHRPLNKMMLYGATNYGQPLRVMELKADGHQHSGSTLTSKPRRDEYWKLEWELITLTVSLIMVMWCNPGVQSLMSHCGPYWCSDWRSRESLCPVSRWGSLYWSPLSAHSPHTSPDVTRCQPCGSHTYDASHIPAFPSLSCYVLSQLLSNVLRSVSSMHFDFII